VRRQIEIVILRSSPRPVDSAPPLDATPEIAAAWRELQLYWLRTVPGLREELRMRINDKLLAGAKQRRRQVDLGVENDPPSRSLEREQQRRVQRGLRDLLASCKDAPVQSGRPKARLKWDEL